MSTPTPRWRERLRDLLALTVGLLHRRRTRQRLDAEIAFHLDQQIQANQRAGMAPAEARRSARRAFGDAARIREEAVDEVESRVLAELARDIQVGARGLRRAPAFAALAGLTLALGVGATTVLFSLADHVALRPLPFPGADRLVVIREIIDEMTDTYPSVAANASHYLEWRRRCGSCADVAAIRAVPYTLLGRGEPEPFDAVRVSANLLPMLGARPLLGRLFTEADDRTGADLVVVLTERAWRRLGADSTLVGRTLSLEARGAPDGYAASAVTAARVIGVVAGGLHFPKGDELGTRLPTAADAFVPLALNERERTTLGEFDYAVVARLAPGASVDAADRELDGIATELARRYPGGLGLSAAVVPMHELVVGSTGRSMLLLLAAIGTVLLIVCVNLANLLLARNLSRAREWSVRLAMGARAGRLVRQTLAESLILGLAGGGLGVLLAWWGLDALLALAPRDLPRLGEIALDGRVLAVSLTLSALVGLAFGALPALRASRAAPSLALAGGRRSTDDRRSGRARATLIAVQVALSTVLFVVTGLFLNSFIRVLQVDPGFEAEQVLAVDVALPVRAYGTPAARTAFLDAVLERLSARPAVRSAAVGTALPLEGETNIDLLSVEADTTPEIARPLASYQVVSGSYFSTLGAPVIAGRPFAAGDRGRPVAMLTSGAAAALWPGEDAVGRRIVLADQSTAWDVIGVVGDMPTTSLERTGVSVVYIPYWMGPPAEVRILVRTRGDPAAAAAMVRDEIRQVGPMVPITRDRTMGSVLRAAVAPRRFQVVLLLGFAVTALVTAAVGIYGIVSHSVARRRGEIGIRMALGARPADVRRLVLREGLGPALIGLAVGLVAALASSRGFAALLFEVRPFDPLTVIAVTLILGGTAGAACWLPARRSARTSPMAALRID